MSTIITADRVAYPFHAADVKNPSAKIMLVEESRETIDDSRWVGSSGNEVTDRHSGGKGNVTFADGHIQAVTPDFGSDPTNSNPTM